MRITGISCAEHRDKPAHCDITTMYGVVPVVDNRTIAYCCETAFAAIPEESRFPEQVSERSGYIVWRLHAPDDTATEVAYILTEKPYCFITGTVGRKHLPSVAALLPA